MDNLGKLYELNPESLCQHNIYLGANIEKVHLPDGSSEWAITSHMHVQNAVKVVENLLAKDNDKTQMNHAAPFSVGLLAQARRFA